jgi:hypothetical protein
MTGLKLKANVAKFGNMNIQAIEAQQQEDNNFVLVGKKVATQNGDAILNAKKVVPNQNQFKLLNHALPFIKAKNIKLKGIKANNFVLKTINALVFNPIKLKGISEQRPEILALTDYSPYYDGDNGFELSDSGLFINTVISSRLLRFENISQLFETLDGTEDAKKIIDEIASNYLKEIDAARNDVEFMTQIAEKIRNSKRAFDIRKDSFLVNANISNQIVNGKSYQDFLVDQYGFTEDGVSNFSNTKLFGQFLFDIRNTLRQYSPSLFGIDLAPNANKFNKNLNFDLGEANNESPSRNSDMDFGKYFSKEIDITDGKFQFNIEFLSNINFSLVGVPFNQFLDLLPEDPEDRIKLLLTLLSKESMISSGLSDKTIVDIIENSFGGSDIGDPFDVIVGLPGEKITDPISGPNSLMSLLRYESSKRIVLPFESFYIRDESQKLYTPGISELIDPILQGEEQFTYPRFTAYQENFSKIIGDSLTVLEGLLSVNTNNKKLKQKHLYSDIVNDFIEAGELLLSTQGQDENVITVYPGAWAEAALLKAAASDREIKQLLFQYILCLGLVGKPGRSQFGNNSVTNFFHQLSYSDIKTYGSLPAIGQNKDLSPSVSGVLSVFLSQLEQAQDQNEGNLPPPVNNNPISATEIVNVPTTDSQAGYTALAFLAESIIDKIRDNTGNFGATGDDVVQTDELFRHMLSTSDLIIFNRIIDFISSIEEKSGAKAYVYDKTRFNRLNHSTMAAFAFEAYLAFVEKFFDGISEPSINPSNNAGAKILRFTIDFEKIKEFISNLKLSTKPVRKSSPKNVAFNSTIAGLKGKLIREENVVLEIIERLRRTSERISAAYNDIVNFFDLNGSNGGKFLKLLEGVGGKERVALINEGQFILARKALDDLEVGEGFTLGARQPKKNKSGMIQANFKSIKANYSGLKYALPLVDNKSQEYPAFLDRSIISPNETKLMKLLFSFPAFRKTRGENLKILSVGIPAGFSTHFQNEVGINEKRFDSINEKEKDVIQINVYRKNIEFEDIVFAPKHYLFEMSRFVSRASLNELEVIEGFNPEALAALGITFMRDYSKRSKGNDVNLAGFLLSEEYKFLENSQKISLVFNHLSSYLLEIYVKLATGISLDETDYLVNQDLLEGRMDDDVRQQFQDLITVYVQGISGQPLTIDQLKSSSPEIKKLLDKIDTFSLDTNFTKQITPPILPGVSRSAAIEITEDLINFLKLYTPKSLLTGGKSQGQRITSPKIFERIFNLAVDPDDFEIDLEATLETKAGSRTYAAIAQRKLLETPKKLKQRPKNKNIQFEQFFVTISTVE